MKYLLPGGYVLLHTAVSCQVQDLSAHIRGCGTVDSILECMSTDALEFKMTDSWLEKEIRDLLSDASTKYLSRYIS
ncbi:hypothetical protein M426DRAFT_149519 [Hypoxylon sp. CI-4A]|nr:hypothetical protein M426DRAFT_149519 [Hypoxylon sp. CI-4A]